MKKSHKRLLFGGLAVAGIYMLMKPKEQPAQAAPESSYAPGTEPWIDYAHAGLDIAKDIVNRASGASEKQAIDGMCPDSLSGHMNSLGAMGELQGTLYGGI